MDGLNLKEKIGALPVWMWALAVVLVALVGYMFVRNGKTATPVNTAGSNIDGTVGYQTSGLSGANSSNNNSTVSPDNNQLWLTRVAAQVAANMSKSPSDVYAALQLWLTGQPITADQKAIVDRALTIGGNPPEQAQGPSPVTPNRTFMGFIRNPAGKISALFSDNTRQEFTTYDAYKQYGGNGVNDFQNVSDSFYQSFTNSGTNPVRGS
jgi:hypothetical protein